MEQQILGNAPDTGPELTRPCALGELVPGGFCMEGHCEQKCNLIATCIPLDLTSIPLDRTFLPLDRTSIPLDRTFLPFDRTSIILSLVTFHWCIPLWHFTFIRTSMETASHRIVTNVRPQSLFGQSSDALAETC